MNMGHGKIRLPSSVGIINDYNNAVIRIPMQQPEAFKAEEAKGRDSWKLQLREAYLFYLDFLKENHMILEWDLLLMHLGCIKPCK